MTIEWQTRSLSDIIKYFAKDFQEMEGKRIVNVEYWVDMTRNEVVFQLFIEDIKKP